MTKITQTNFAKPPMSWLRKMSAKTVISNQIQMKNRKNQSIDQNTWPVPNCAASIALLCLVGPDWYRVVSGRWDRLGDRWSVHAAELALPTRQQERVLLIESMLSVSCDLAVLRVLWIASRLP